MYSKNCNRKISCPGQYKVINITLSQYAIAHIDDDTTKVTQVEPQNCQPRPPKYLTASSWVTTFSNIWITSNKENVSKTDMTSKTNFDHLVTYKIIVSY